MSQNENGSNNIMERLKESTAVMHDAAESSQFQAHLAQGKLPISCYADYLEQLFLIHRALEDSFSFHQGKGDRASRIVTEQQRQKDFLNEDLKALGRNAEHAKSVPSTKKILAEIEQFSQSQPSALLGMHYVLLGSKHGGKFIAKTCQDSYKFSDGAGVRYFDPYGSNFMPIWKDFKESMNQLNLSKQEADEICKAAGIMFATIGQIGAELMPATKNA
ncbi:MAG: biliverdin-producing heme oxygenase [Candidatus Obscuribacterales bacterium]|jgi:heme oxygenase|nr:biliverdin-producing heme oxygenase [Candidatus Obscuribacterales bacterium]